MPWNQLQSLLHPYSHDRGPMYAHDDRSGMNSSAFWKLRSPTALLAARKCSIVGPRVSAAAAAAASTV
jgi:hypothetical protein